MKRVFRFDKKIHMAEMPIPVTRFGVGAGLASDGTRPLLVSLFDEAFDGKCYCLSFDNRVELDTFIESLNDVADMIFKEEGG